MHAFFGDARSQNGVHVVMLGNVKGVCEREVVRGGYFFVVAKVVY